jgi:hypothetical protein
MRILTKLKTKATSLPRGREVVTIAGPDDIILVMGARDVTTVSKILIT